MMFPEKILALSPHTDDIELGCGGTLSRLLDQGSSVHVVNFCRSKDNEEDNGELVCREFKKSMDILGASYEMLDMQTRRLDESRQEILDYLYNKRDGYDLIFCHSSYDKHQDHQTVYQEAFRAFKDRTILGYELPWNCMQFSTDVFIKLRRKHINKKIEMLDCYKSQQHRAFVNKQYIGDIARTRGLQVGVKYAECFELIRGVL